MTESARATGSASTPTGPWSVIAIATSSTVLVRLKCRSHAERATEHGAAQHAGHELLAAIALEHPRGDRGELVGRQQRLARAAQRGRELGGARDHDLEHVREYQSRGHLRKPGQRRREWDSRPRCDPAVICSCAGMTFA
jgi:hypothetical protein